MRTLLGCVEQESQKKVRIPAFKESSRLTWYVSDINVENMHFLEVTTPAISPLKLKDAVAPFKLSAAIFFTMGFPRNTRLAVRK